MTAKKLKDSEFEILPQFPRVYSEDNLVIIEYKDGNKHYWGREKDSNEAFTVAETMDLELRILSYLQSSVGNSLKDILESISNTAPTETIMPLLNDVLREQIRAIERSS